MTAINAQEFLTLRSTKNLFVVDLRTPAEVEKESLDDCHCLPVHEISSEKMEELLQTKGKTKDEPIYLLCQSGKRAEMALQKLAKDNFNMVMLNGGLNAIKSHGAKIKEGQRKVIPLERQVRITAGLLVLTGVALGFLLNPALFLLSGFIGAGLVFSGVTDTCPMAMAIAQMPWNQSKP